MKIPLGPDRVCEIHTQQQLPDLHAWYSLSKKYEIPPNPPLLRGGLKHLPLF